MDLEGMMYCAKEHAVRARRAYWIERDEEKAREEQDTALHWLKIMRKEIDRLTREGK